LTYLYSPPDHDLPEGITREQLRQYEADFYALKKTIHRHVPAGKSKPNPDVRRQIMNEIGVEPSRCVYIGDNLFKDVTMAQSAAVIDVYASYGTGHREAEK
jgi:phosphoglycolate phosphatase-like HAD superfamily hydrolase